MNRVLRLCVLLALLAPAAALLAAVPSAPDPNDDTASLTGQLLIATPQMADPRFRETVLVVIRHGKDGALAIIINRPLGDQPAAKILAAIGENSEGVTGTIPVFAGGPVEPTQGFVLHSTDYRGSGTLDITADVAVTATPEIIRQIASKKGPKKSLLAFGYAGWAPGQLESELRQHIWYTAPVDPKLVFDEDRDRLWELAVDRRPRDL